MNGSETCVIPREPAKRGLVIPAALAVALLGVSPLGGHAQVLSSVSGHISILYGDNRPARDVGGAVVWLDPGHPEDVTPQTRQVAMVVKAFRPSVVVVPVGSTVAFANHDAVEHNVFSLSREARFDLGFFGRDGVRSHTFENPGVVHVYCNIHPGMSAFVLVRDSPYFKRPSGDGSFSIDQVPPGPYVLHVWHERTGDYQQDVVISESGMSGLTIQLTTNLSGLAGFRARYVRPYAQRGRRN